MALRLSRDQLLAAGLAAALVTVGLLGPLSPARGPIIGVALLVGGAYLVWHVHPAWTLSAGICLSVVAGNWENLGIPGFLAPDRWLLVGGVAAVLFRAPPIRDRPPLRFGAVHWVMVLTVVWMWGEGTFAQTLSDKAEVFKLFERLGVLPYLLFLVAPVVFAEESRRRTLLAALVGLGGYLGFTAFMETANIGPLVVPSFINDTSIGFHPDRARGPFLEAVTNGAGLYTGVLAAAVALYFWRGTRSRQAALAVLGLCAVGMLFTETRSVWLGGVVATVVALLAVRELRVWFLPVVGLVAALMAISLTTVPGLADRVTERSNDQRTVWDRKNLGTAAANMVEAHPLVGVGWGRFQAESAPYFEENQDFPLTATDEIIHNVFLTYAAETGLIGLSLWLLTLGMGAAAALRPGTRPEARPWKVAAGAFLVFYLTIASFVFSQVYPNNMVWLLMGVAVGAGGAIRPGGAPEAAPEG
ncbi:MAG TPA: O-antigen ligase family protein [Thermoleophilaceae bacterium]|nr:O-antigen ligase family protein [Thermoleophilaceae bacterium]